MSEQIIQLFVNGISGKTTTVNIMEGASIDQLIDTISELTSIPSDELRLIYTGKEIRSQSDKGTANYLKDYGISNLATLFLVLRLRGGSYGRKFASGVKLTEKADIITLDDEQGGQRTEMNCGHAIGPDSLLQYSDHQVNQGRYEIRCPYKQDSCSPFCDSEWEFLKISRIIALHQDEKTYFEEKLGENYLQNAVRIQECPGCQSFCIRQRKTDMRVVCPVCTKNNGGKQFEFCWGCLRKWIAGGKEVCGNADCDGQDPKLKILKNCPTKDVVGVECPSIRACPNPECGMMIAHLEACKHMHCRCGQKFCFICLKNASSTGTFQCGSYNTKCTTAERQTEIGGC